MRYEIHPTSANGARAIVLGAVEGSGNIGAAVADRFGLAGWTTFADDCAVGDGSRPPGGNLPNDEVAERFGYSITEKGRYQRFEAPSVDQFDRWNAEALVVTLGKTYKGHFAEISPWTVGNILRANLLLPLECVKRYVDAMEIRAWSGTAPTPRHIVLVGSYAHNHPFTNGTLYCAAKAGLDMAARTLGWELTDRGYRVHVVHPYHVQGTPMWAEVEKGVMASKGMTFEEADAYNRKDLKMPDLLTASEVAEVIFQVVNNKCLNWVTGPIELYGGSR
jgi:NAD(P)-dependent dehydrogenase (short-subunit alcohol dehydrogenase family)